MMKKEDLFMKKKALVLLALLLALSLTACGGNSAGGADSSAPMDAMANQSAPSADTSYEAGWDMPMEPEGEYQESASGSVYGGMPENAKVIYSADLSLETKEFDQTSRTLASVVSELGGYFESRSLSQGGVYRSMDCVVRVPAENFVVFLDRAGEAAHMTYRHEYSDDVSEVYYDSEARLTTQRTKLERLQELLSKAEDMADIITIETAISETELEIEYLTGSLRKYDSQINYSTVNLSLYEVYRLSTDEEAPVTFGDRFGTALASGFQRGIDGLEDFAITIARNWVALLIWAAVIAVAVVILRKQARRKKAARIAAAIPPQPPEEQAKPQDGQTEQ